MGFFLNLLSLQPAASQTGCIKVEELGRELLPAAPPNCVADRPVRNGVCSERVLKVRVVNNCDRTIEIEFSGGTKSGRRTVLRRSNVMPSCFQAKDKCESITVSELHVGGSSNPDKAIENRAILGENGSDYWEKKAADQRKKSRSSEEDYEERIRSLKREHEEKYRQSIDNNNREVDALTKERIELDEMKMSLNKNIDFLKEKSENTAEHRIIGCNRKDYYYKCIDRHRDPKDIELCAQLCDYPPNCRNKSRYDWCINGNWGVVLRNALKSCEEFCE